MILPRHQEQLFYSTVRIYVENPATGKSEKGTGFLVLQTLPANPEFSVLILVTCRHCLFGGDGLVTLIFHRRDPSNPAVPLVSKGAIVRSLPYRSAYYAHDDPGVDLAAISVSLLIGEPRDLFYQPIRVDHFAESSLENVLPAMDVYFIGYPMGLYDEAHNLPILRKGCIASIPHVDFDDKPEFLIDAQVYPGSSGSPVFVQMGHRLRFVGVLGRVKRRVVPVEDVGVGLRSGIRDPIELGIVYKPAAVLDVIKKVVDDAQADLPSSPDA